MSDPAADSRTAPSERTRLLPTAASPASPRLRPSRPRSIRSIASHDPVAASSSRQGSPEPSDGASDRGGDGSPSKPGRTKRTLRSRLLFATIVVLLAVCVYASFVDDFMGDVEATISCGTCIALLAPLQALARIGDDAFVDLFVGFCTKLGIEDGDVCAGAVGTQAPILAHDLRSITLASPAAKNFCTTIFGLCPLPNTIPHTVNVSDRPAEAVAGDLAFSDRRARGHRVRKQWKSRGRKPFQVVHISDVHVDREYTVRLSHFLSLSEYVHADCSPSPARRVDRLLQSHLLPRLRPDVYRTKSQVPGWSCTHPLPPVPLRGIGADRLGLPAVWAQEGAHADSPHPGPRPYRGAGVLNFSEPCTV